MILLIDADILKYRASASIEKMDKETETLLVEPVHHAYYNVNSMVRKIFKDLQTTKAEFFLTKQGARDNFRYQIYPDYKANRKNSRLPVHISDVYEYIKKRYKARVSEGQEADDDISIRHYELNQLGWDKDIKNSVIVSIDKDFNNLPGWHYNFVKKDLYFVDELEAKRNFYLQVLTGDSVDNIPRVKKGWLKKKTEEKLKKCLTEDEMIDIVKLEIKANNEEEVDDYFTKIGRLVHLRTKPNELWSIPR